MNKFDEQPVWALLIVIALVVYSLIIRFNNPELTETQLFLKMIGLL